MTNATQFIGSKISLISKSEIRYEGILYSLDIKEATISLAKVRSFGTEERPTDHPAPPRDETYDFIVFRGADIRYIDVVEPPKKTTTSKDGIPIPIDPAIVEVSHQHPRNRGSSFSRLSSGQSTTRSRNQQRSRGNSSHEKHIEDLIEGLFGGGSGQSDAETQVQRPPRRNRTPNGGRRDVSERDGRGQGRAPYRRDREQTQGFYGRRNYNYSPRGGWGGRGYFRRPQGILRAPQSAKVKFETDFDFEKSNEELLNKLKEVKVDQGEEVKEEEAQETLVQEQEGQENKDPEIFYKKDDFFDSISCEALQRAKGPMAKPDWRKELKLNAETFGLSGQRRRPSRPGFYNNRGGGYDSRWFYDAPQSRYGNRFNNGSN